MKLVRLTVVKLIVPIINVVYSEWHKSQYTECRYAERHVNECRGTILGPCFLGLELKIEMSIKKNNQWPIQLFQTLPVAKSTNIFTKVILALA